MRIAVKYAMDDIQVAIAKVIELTPPHPPQGLSTAILRLAFVAEFQSHFTRGVAVQVFTQASSIDHRPTADHLEPLMPFPAFVALMMQYREGLRDKNTAPWNGRRGDCNSWLDQELGHFGFKGSSLRVQRPSDWRWIGSTSINTA